MGDDDDGGVQADTTLTTALLNAASKAPPTVSEEDKVLFSFTFYLCIIFLFSFTEILLMLLQNAILRSLWKKPKNSTSQKLVVLYLYFYIYGLIYVLVINRDVGYRFGWNQ